MTRKALPLSFYTSEDVVKISQDLLGKILVTQIGRYKTSGMIVETEAYKGAEDKASHAYNNRRTKRTEVMFNKGGVAYIPLCYGIHYMLNIVTALEEVPHAVLIRAIGPIDGVELMLNRRNLTKLSTQLSSGPGKLTQALGITSQMNGTSLRKSPLWIEEGKIFKKSQVSAGPRIGIDYAEEFKNMPWRFWVKNNQWVSRQTSRVVKI